MKDFEDEREKDREIGELKIAEGLGKGGGRWCEKMERL